MSLVSNGNLPSLQIAVISKDQIIWSKSFGQNTGTDFVYMNGSIQKVFDAAAVLQLHERGQIDIYEDINKYISFSVRHPEYPDIPITIQMLLAHISGLGGFHNQFTWDTEGLFDTASTENMELAALSLEDFLITSFDTSGLYYSADVWSFEPGTNYNYSVSAYPLLRHLIEKVSGMIYPEFMRKNIFDPLDMQNSGFTTHDSTKKYTIPFTCKDEKNEELPLWNGNGYMMSTTAEDMGKFMIANLNKGNYNNFQLIQEKTIALMHEKHIPGKSIFNPFSNCPFSGYGLGIIQYGDDWFGHGGSTVGFQSLWSFNKSTEKGYIILTNTNGILNGRESFNSVWASVSSVERIIKSDLGPSSRPWNLIFMIFLPIGIMFASIIFYKHRKSRAIINTQ